MFVFVRGVGDENEKRARKSGCLFGRHLKYVTARYSQQKNGKKHFPRGCEVCFFRERHEVARFSVREW
jgi:hypothetical protein